MNNTFYKYCAVPFCTNTTVKTPAKLFIHVPRTKRERNKWLILARRDPDLVSLKSKMYFCEDHFNLPNDMENYMMYHVMGFVRQIRMKSDCVPTRFDCQKPCKNIKMIRKVITRSSDAINNIEDKEHKEIDEDSDSTNSNDKISKSADVDVPHRHGSQIGGVPERTNNIRTAKTGKLKKRIIRPHSDSFSSDNQNPASSTPEDQECVDQQTEDISVNYGFPIQRKHKKTGAERAKAYRARKKALIQNDDSVSFYKRFSRKSLNVKKGKESENIQEVAVKERESTSSERVIENLTEGREFIFKKIAEDDSTDNVDVEDATIELKELCRICLDFGSGMFNIVEHSFGKIYEHYIGTKIKEDQLPQSVCAKCVTSLFAANHFLERVSKSREFLVNTLVANKCIREEELNEIKNSFALDDARMRESLNSEIIDNIEKSGVDKASCNNESDVNDATVVDSNNDLIKMECSSDNETDSNVDWCIEENSKTGTELNSNFNDKQIINIIKTEHNYNDIAINDEDPLKIDNELLNINESRNSNKSIYIDTDSTTASAESDSSCNDLNDKSIVNCVGNVSKVTSRKDKASFQVKTSTRPRHHSSVLKRKRNDIVV